MHYTRRKTLSLEEKRLFKSVDTTVKESTTGNTQKTAGGKKTDKKYCIV